MLIARPYRPRDQRRGGRGAPKSRRQTKQPMVRKYEERIEVPPSEVIAFNASVEPRLISDRRLVTTKDTMTARRGIFHPGVTFEKKEENGTPY